MAKGYSVTPNQASAGGVFTASLRDASGRRVKRSFGTRDKDEAKAIARDLVGLHYGRVPPQIHPTALRLYYGESTAAMDGDVDVPDLVNEDLPHGPGEVRLMVSENIALREQVRRMASENAKLHGELTALRNTVVGRMVEAQEACPDLGEALALFQAHQQANVSAQECRDVFREVEAFVASLPKSVVHPTRIEAKHLNDWLDAVTADSERRASRRKKKRNRVGRFITWCSRQWRFPSVMLEVKGPTKSQVARDQSEIVWHEKAVVETVLSDKDAYWQALIATMAYAGLRRTELIWLRREDFIRESDGNCYLWVTNVETSDGRHEVKTGQGRKVPVHPELLVPRLLSHIEAVSSGAEYLFPKPKGMRRRRDRSGRISEQWKADSLSTVLLGHAGGVGRKPSLGILPEGMSAASLRRTFGSLLLRDGKSVEQVAAVMGNTPAVVRKHYARILGHEVDVSF